MDSMGSMGSMDSMDRKSERSRDRLYAVAAICICAAIVVIEVGMFVWSVWVNGT